MPRYHLYPDDTLAEHIPQKPDKQSGGPWVEVEDWPGGLRHWLYEGDWLTDNEFGEGDVTYSKIGIQFMYDEKCSTPNKILLFKDWILKGSEPSTGFVLSVQAILDGKGGK